MQIWRDQTDGIAHSSAQARKFYWRRPEPGNAASELSEISYFGLIDNILVGGVRRSNSTDAITNSTRWGNRRHL